MIFIENVKFMDFKTRSERERDLNHQQAWRNVFCSNTIDIEIIFRGIKF